MLTGVEDSSVHPALSETDRDSGVGVLQQDFGAASPRRRGFAHGIVIAPVPNHHTVVILRVHLQERAGQRSAKNNRLLFFKEFNLSSLVWYPTRSCCRTFHWAVVPYSSCSCTIKTFTSDFFMFCWCWAKTKGNWPDLKGNNMLV